MGVFAREVFLLSFYDGYKGPIFEVLLLCLKCCELHIRSLSKLMGKCSFEAHSDDIDKPFWCPMTYHGVFQQIWLGALAPGI